MKLDLESLPFITTDWNRVEPEPHPGINGQALWRTRQFGSARVRMVEYTPGYRADHLCAKGHILLVLEGELNTELSDGRCLRLGPGMSYQVADGTSEHRSWTDTGAKLFIVDGG
jgi:hypothetical protein